MRVLNSNKTKEQTFSSPTKEQELCSAIKELEDYLRKNISNIAYVYTLPKLTDKEVFENIEAECEKAMNKLEASFLKSYYSAPGASYSGLDAWLPDTPPKPFFGVDRAFRTPLKGDDND